MSKVNSYERERGLTPFYGGNPELKSLYHHLKMTANCQCQLCQQSAQRLEPEIFIDQQYESLKKNNALNASSSYTVSSTESFPDRHDFSWFLRKLSEQSKSLPHINILDTVVLTKGSFDLYVFNEDFHCSPFQSPKCKMAKCNQSVAGIKNVILTRKNKNDLEYQKKKYKEQHPSFEFAQLDHESEKIIKQFEEDIKFIDQIHNRVAIVKHAGESSGQQIEEKVLTKYEFCNLFDKTRVKICELDQVQSIKLFPVMYQEEEFSYIKRVKYFRAVEEKKPLFKEAESYVLAWLTKNESLQKLEQEFMQQTFRLGNKQNSDIKKLGVDIISNTDTHIHRIPKELEEQYLEYLTFKICLHFEAEVNICIDEALFEYITNDMGSTFWLKDIRFIKDSKKHQIQQKENKLPKHKKIDKEDYIEDLSNQMRSVFEKFKMGYNRLDADWKGFEKKWDDDRRVSNDVFNAVRREGTVYSQGRTDQLDFHAILGSNDQAYKQQVLGLNRGKKKTMQN